MDEKHLKMWFYKGLLPGIRTRMPTGSDKFQLCEMLQHARYFEQLLADEEEATISREAAGALNVVAKVNTDTSELDAIKQSLAQLTAIIQALPRSGSQNTKPSYNGQRHKPPYIAKWKRDMSQQCSWCGRVGHTSSECRNKASGKPQVKDIRAQPGATLMSVSAHGAPLELEVGIKSPTCTNPVKIPAIWDTGASVNFVTQNNWRRNSRQ
jgi:hypothetical protein